MVVLNREDEVTRVGKAESAQWEKLLVTATTKIMVTNRCFCS